MALTTHARSGRPARAKATFTLATDLLAEVKKAARDEESSSTAFVAEAIREKLDRMEAERRHTLLEQASRDPLFLEDVESVQRDFVGSELPPRRPRRGNR